MKPMGKGKAELRGKGNEAGGWRGKPWEDSREKSAGEEERIESRGRIVWKRA